MNDSRPIALIGYRGTGKTTVAQLLARRLGWDWVDADVEVELRAGKSIAAIFADDGEPAFRDLEAQVVAELCSRERTVFASAAGPILREDQSRRHSRDARRSSGCRPRSSACRADCRGSDDRRAAS